MIDSLLHELQTRKKDTAKAKLLNSISFAFEDIDPEEGIKYGKQDLALAEKLYWKPGIASALNALGVNFTENLEYDSASDRLNKGLKIYQDLRNNAGIARSLCDLGVIYFRLSDYTKALEYAFNSLKSAEELEDKYLIAKNYVNIGNIFRLQHNFPRSMDYHFKAMKLCIELNNKSLSAKNLMDLGTAYIQQENYVDALKYYQEARTLYEDIGNQRGLAFAYMNIGTVYQVENHPLKALDYVFNALKIDRRINYQVGMARDYGHLGQFYRLMAYHEQLSSHTKNAEYISSAIKYTDSAITIEKKAGNMDRVAVAYICLARAQELAGRDELAIDDYEQALAIKDSAFSADSKIQIANLDVKRETELREKQVEINKVLEIKKRNERTLFIGGIGLLAAVTLVVARNYNLQKKANSQKDMLMKEIHHRVKNNLQVISSLLSLQSDTLKDPAAKAALSEGENRLRTIALIHQKLYQDDKPDKVNISSLADELFMQLNSALGKKDPGVNFTNDIPGIFLDNDVAVPLGLILNELITNSYKYAFDKNATPQIRINLTGQQSHYRLKYSDNGPGLPLGLDIARSNSLGLRLVTGLAKQIKGKATYNEGANGSFIITFADKT